MIARTRRLAPFATVLALGLLAGCGSEGEGSGGSSDAEPSTVTVTETATPDAADGPAQQELTEEQITAALPTAKEAPDGFEEDSNVRSGGKSTRVTDPDRCRAIYLDTDEFRSWSKEHSSAVGAVRYTEAGDAAGRPSVSVFVNSYDTPIPKKFFDQAGSALGQCAGFREKVRSSSSWIDKRANNISAPVIGDQSFAQRVGLTEMDLTIDQLYVRSGHNLINVRVLTGYSEYSDETLGELAEGVLEDLEG